MDILIKNGRIVDGTGNPWFYSDLLLSNGEIKTMGRRLDVPADKVIDAEGLTVAPGFVNPHDHVDGIVFFRPDMQPWITQGITTSMCGNCSFSPYPDKATWLEHTATNPEVELVTYSEKVRTFPQNWSSLTEYAAAVNETGFSRGGWLPQRAVEITSFTRFPSLSMRSSRYREKR